MGILATLFGKGSLQRLDTGPWQPRLASATLRYMDRKGIAGDWEHPQVRQWLMSQWKILCRLGSQVDYTHVSNNVK